MLGPGPHAHARHTRRFIRLAASVLRSIGSNPFLDGGGGGGGRGGKREGGY